MTGWCTSTAHQVFIQQVQIVSIPPWELGLVMEKSFSCGDNSGWKGARSSLVHALTQSRASFDVKAKSGGKSCSQALCWQVLSISKDGHSPHLVFFLYYQSF